MAESVNNHIHTDFSFSPYSPAAAVRKAKEAGLATAGLMDHDTLAGAPEFRRAAVETALPVTVGLECRADFSKTRLGGRRLNNPDQISVGYVAVHAVPEKEEAALQAYFLPFIRERDKRNRLMTERLNNIMHPFGITLDYESTVLPLSRYREGGTVTERHILFGLAQGLEKKFGRGRGLCAFLSGRLNLALSGKVLGFLEDPANPYYDYDLLGVLKSGLVEQFYVDATGECPDITELCRKVREHHAILAYAYLGDVTDSVTGDKKAQLFEDGFLDLLFKELERLGFMAVTYMPSRNTPAQIERVQALCAASGLLEISGEDINSPRQSFISAASDRPAYAHLKEAAWALIGHEIACARGPEQGIFSHKAVKEHPELKTRVRYFATLAREHHQRNHP